MPTVEVTGTAPGVLRQDSPVGPYISRNGPPNAPLAQAAFTCGRPGRSSSTSSGRRNGRMAKSSTAFVKKLKSVCRTAFSSIFIKTGASRKETQSYRGSSVELRYALANWGKIPLNPTLYGEWNFNDAAA